MEDKNTGVLSHFLNVGAGVIINMLLGLITTPLITRIADPSEYGQLSIFTAYNDIAIAICFFGLDNGIIRFFYDAKDIKDKRSLLKLCFGVPILTSIIISSCYIGLVALNIIKTPFDRFVLTMLVVYLFVSIWEMLSNIILRLTYQTKIYSLCTVVKKIVYCSIIISYALAIKGNYLYMLVTATVVSSASVGFIATYKTKEYWDFRDIMLPLNKKDVLRYSAPFILYTCMCSFMESLDKFSVEYYYGDYEVGIYASALALVGIFMIVRDIFQTVWIPMQTQHFVETPDDKQFIQKGNRYLTILMFFIAINGIFFKDIICYFLGADYRVSVNVFPFLLTGTIFFAISDTATSGIEYSKRSYLHVVISVVALIFNLLGNIFLVKYIGPRGAAISTCVSYSIYLILRIYYSNKYYPIDYGVKKLYLVGLMLLGFSYVESFIDVFKYNLICYLIIMAVFIVVYFKDMCGLFNFAKSEILHKK